MMEISANSGANNGMDVQIAAALDWWRNAGVDCAFIDEPANWIAVAEPEQPAAPPAPASPSAPAKAAPPASAIDHSGWPQDLATFAAWWCVEPTLDNGQTARRVAPRGPANAEVMVLVPHPESEDREILLAGPQGRLLDAMLAAMGLAPAKAYIASVLPRHTPHADWAGIKGQGIGDVLAHHIRLAAPRRLIALGGIVLPLLGHDPAKSADASLRFNHEGGNVPLLADRDLGALLERAAWRSRFWQRWLNWSAEN